MKFNLFPAQNVGIESTWWTRGIKTLIIILTVGFAFIYYVNAVSIDMRRVPYYDYSFDPNFNHYSEPTINCNGIPGNCLGAQNTDASSIVIAYQNSSSERNDEVSGMFAQTPNLTYDQALSILESKGEINNNLQAKDINDVSEYIRNDWLKLIIYTVLFFLFLTQIILRIIFYIIYGKKRVVH